MRSSTLFLVLAALAATPGCGSDTAETGRESVRPTYLDDQRSTLSDRRDSARELMDSSLTGRSSNGSASSPWYSGLTDWLF